MRLRRLEIRNFRGIGSLDWNVNSDLVALVGPGDVGKSTVLDAIEMTLSARWAIPITENDFHRRTADAIEITCYVADLPQYLLSDRRFGLDLQGIAPDGAVHDEPIDGCTPVLAVRLTVDASYEPQWAVVNARLAEGGKRIGSGDRRYLGLTRLGFDAHRHLSWSRGSALGSLSDEGDGLAAQVAAAARTMREAIRTGATPVFSESITAATSAARKFGVGPAAESLTAQLNADAFDLRVPSLALHADDVPFDRSGLGTRRLMALALQHESVMTGGIALIDEVESGLEPYRLRHLLRVLHESIGQEHGQVILTTHASTVVEELPAPLINVVGKAATSPGRAPAPGAQPDAEQGVRVISQVPSALQSTLRSNSESLFARRLVICEGKTEIGVLRGLTAAWASRRGCPPSHRGAVYADGGGGSTCDRTVGFHHLGYPTLVLADSDREIDPDGKLANSGIPVIRWAEETAIEQRLFLDLPIAAVHELVRIALEDATSEQSIIGQVVARLPGGQSTAPQTLAALFEGDIPEDDLRVALGAAAKEKSWYKRIDRGELVGETVGRSLAEVADTDLGRCLGRVEAWIYDLAE